MKVTSKRRRTRQEIEDAKVSALAKEQAVQDKLKTIDRLQAQLAEVQAQQQVYQKDQEALGNMLQAGFLARDENGNYVPGEAISESQQM